MNLRVAVHGGFRSVRPPDGIVRTYRNDAMVGKTNEWAARRLFDKVGRQEWLKQMNVKEYRDLVKWYRVVQAQHTSPELDSPQRREAGRQIQEIERWLSEFTSWFYRNRIPVPDVQVPPKVIVAQRKYSAKHFREVVTKLKTLNKKGALDEVCEKYHFSSREGFEKQFNKWYDLRPKKKGGKAVVTKREV